MADWKDAYAVRASLLGRGLRKQNEKDAELDAADIAMANFRRQLSSSSTPVKDPRRSDPTYSPTGYNPKGDDKGFLDQPVIKGFLDALSVGTYTVANAADNALEVAEKASRGENVIGDALTLLPRSAIEGVKGAFGNEEETTTFSEVIERGQKNAGIDPTSKESRAVQGVAGFTGDVLLDPLTYATIGAAPLIKGAVKGASMGTSKASKKIDDAVKEARDKGLSEEQIDTAIRNNPEFETFSNPIKGAGKGAVREYKDWRSRYKKRAQERFDVGMSRLKGEDKNAPAIAATSLGDNIADRFNRERDFAFSVDSSGNAVAREPIVPKSTTRVPVKERKKVEEEKPVFVDEITETEIPIQKEATENLLDVTEEIPVAKEIPLPVELSPAQKLVEAMQKVNFNTSKYSQAQLNKLKKQIEDNPARITRKVERPKEVPQGVLTVGKYEIDESKFVDKLLARGPGNKPKQILLKNGKNKPGPLLAKDFNAAKAAGNTELQQKILNAINPGFFSTLKTVGGKKKLAESDAIDDILDDGFDYIEEANPNAFNIDDAVALGFEGLDTVGFSNVDELVENLPKILLPVERKATTKELNKMKAYIKSDRITDEELDILREVTGKTAKADVANAWTAAVVANKKEINDLLNPPVKPKKEQLKELTDEDIANVAEELASSPKAYDALAGKERLINNYVDAVAEVSRAEGGKDIINAADRVMETVLKGKHGQINPGRYQTNRKYQTNTKDANTGGAWKRERWNSMHNITLHQATIDEMLEILPKSPKPSSYKRAKTYMQILRLTDAKMRASGIQPYMSVVGSIKGQRLPKKAQNGQNLSLYDVLSEMKFDDVYRFMFFGGNKAAHSFDPMDFMGAVEAMLRGKIADIPEDALKRDVASWLTSAHRKAGYGQNMAKAKRDALKEKFGDDLGTALEKARLIKPEADKLAHKLVTDTALYHRLSIRKLINSTQHATEVGARIDDITADVLRQLNETGNANDFVKTMKENLGNLSKTFEGDELELARKTMETKISKLLSVGERSAIEVTETIANKVSVPKAQLDESLAKAAIPGKDGKPAHTANGSKKGPSKGTPSDISKLQQKNSAQAEADVEASLKRDGVQVEEFEKIGATIATDLVRKLHPIQSFFNPRLGISSEGVYRAMNSGLHTVARMQNEFHDSLLQFIGRHGNEVLSEDFKWLQKATLENSTGKLRFERESQRELNNTISMMFDVSGKNIFARNAIGADHFNQLADVARLNPNWRFDRDQGPLHNSLLWRQWEGIDNVPDFLSKMHSVVIRASQDIAIAADFSRRFGSIQPKPGYVKIVDKNRANNESGMYELIDRDLYYPKEVATEFAAVDKLMKESRSLDASKPFGKFMVNVFDPITNALKASQTTVRPGHWVISILGDALRNQMLGVNSIVPYRQSVAILKAGGREFKEMGPLERYARSQEMRDIPVHGNEKGMSLHIGGRFVNVSYESVYKIMEPVVMLPPHRSGGVMEDLLMNEATTGFGNAIAKATDKVVANPNMPIVGSLNELSAKRDNFSRVALASDFISKRKWKSVEEMKNAVEDFVTQSAPTSTDFTAKEAKYGRRSLLYYTWLRGITPRVIETALNKPGVTTILPKAMYNLAEANGIDPQSIGNPFPEEGLFPEYYMKNVLGPQWKDDYGTWGINPSSPVIEVFNTFGGLNASDPVGSAQAAGQSLLGMASPFIRMPLELAQGAQTNGIPIEDNMQYIGDNLGGSYLAALSRGTGKTINQNGIVDRTDSAAKFSPEEQAEHGKLQLFNFLTGLKLTDYQSDSAIRSAAWALENEAVQRGTEAMRSQ